MAKEQQEITGEKVSENVYLCPDGKYRWYFEFDMLKNPSILITVCKVILLAYGIVMAAMMLLQFAEGTFRNVAEFWDFYRGFVILLAVLLALAVVAYLIVAASFGWKYMVLLTMDDEEVEQCPMKKEFDKAQAIGWLTAAVGLATGKVGMVGTGVLAASRNSSTSVFEHVRKVKAKRSRNVIYVNQLLGHNQIYAEDADFDFVRDYIVAHCPNAKIRGR
ncbi:MAG: hypothetical protein IKE43_01885 [Coriobacteriales bacterium]|nr:hypothetical protein [Coriobacteriales bacterium]